MSEHDETLEGWVPEIGDDLPLARVVDFAFDYRGNTTVVKLDGTEVCGYVFNRNADAAEPFIQMFDADGAGPYRVLYSEVRTIKFTGKDMAVGQSYAARLERRKAGRQEHDTATAAAPRGAQPM